MEVQPHIFLSSALEDSGWLGFYSDRLVGGQYCRCPLCEIQRRCGQSDENQNSCLCQESNPGHLTHSKSIYWLRYQRLINIKIYAVDKQMHIGNTCVSYTVYYLKVAVAVAPVIRAL
jgi:hypothetical protein